jgi:glycosyltransferase involved in cell wall biosynthesis
VRVCLVYDCLYPHTVGGAERWYRNVAESLSAEGHDVTYLTLRQWPRGEHPRVGSGARVVAVGPRMALYTQDGRRRILPPLVFGLGVLVHLLRNLRSYDVVHTASFPYFSLLAAGLVRPLATYTLAVDWHEVWSRDYWREYLGRLGAIGYAVQLACVRIKQRAFCFSRLHAARLRSEGLHGEITILEGEYAGSLEPPIAHRADPLVVFAGRMIPEKRALNGLAGVLAALKRVPGLRAIFFGDGPERTAVLWAVIRASAQQTVAVPGFVPSEELDAALDRALCMLLPSRREGYGMVVVEAASHGTPSVVVAGEDNAATELIEEGVNGFVAPTADAEAIAEAILRVHRGGLALRESTASWFARNADRLSLKTSLQTVLDDYARAGP